MRRVRKLASSLQIGTQPGTSMTDAKQAGIANECPGQSTSCTFRLISLGPLIGSGRRARFDLLQ
jgi:hypothetical protein